MEPYSDLGEALHQLMDLNGVGQKQLALKADLNETAIRDILKGKSRNPRRDTLIKISNALQCDPLTMLTGQAVSDSSVISLPCFRKIYAGRSMPVFDATPIHISLPTMPLCLSSNSEDIFVLPLAENWKGFSQHSLLAFSFSTDAEKIPDDSPVLFRSTAEENHFRLGLLKDSKPEEEIAAIFLASLGWQGL